MSTLHVRNVPDDLYARVRRLAAATHRSLSAEVIALLTQAIRWEEQRARQGQVLDDIRRHRHTPPPGTPDAVDLLREDRTR